MKEDSPVCMPHNEFNAKVYFAGLYEIRGNKAYLYLSGGDVVSRIVGSPCLGDRTKKIVLLETDGLFNTVIKCTPRFVMALLRCHLATEAYARLSQKLADSDIRTYFYDLWLANHNVNARTQASSEFNAMRRCAKHRKTPLAKFGMSSRHGMSVRSAAAQYGVI